MILVSLPSFNIGTNLKINLDGEKDKPDAKPKNEPDIKSNKERKQDTKPSTESNKEQKQDTKPNIEFKQDVKMIKNEHDMNKITSDEEKVALVLGITSIFTLWWMFK